MIKRILLSGIVIFFTSISSQGRTFKNETANEKRIKIDRHIETVEKMLRSKTYSSACNEAITAADLIEKHLYELKELEPQYNWGEMRNVLLEVPTRHCQ